MGAARRCMDNTQCHSRFIVLTILTLLLPSSIGVPSLGVPSSPLLKADIPDEAVQAFSGIHKASNFASTIIYGEGIAGRGRLGHYSWTGDVNGDGLNDLVVAAPGAPGVGNYEDEGRIYIFYGQSGGPPHILDLDQVEPDILIISNNTWFYKKAVGAQLPPYPVQAYLTNEFDTGDYDGDGYRDMALSIPGTDTPTWGVIIYGREQGFPRELVVHLQRKGVFSNVMGDIRSLWFDNRSLAPGQDEIILPSYMETSDLDGDGADELISGGRFGVNILWGRSNKWTTMNGTTPYDHFGYALDIGDVDGDDRDDILIGAPLADDPLTDRTDCGAAYLIMNISRAKAATSLLIDDIAGTVVFGGSDHDQLGRTVLLSDLDRDEKDDMVLAAPEADGGPGVLDCGKLYAYKGGPESSFPQRMVSDGTAYWTVIGHTGKVSGTNEYPGDRTGAVMGTGDVDGDGNEEFVLGLYSRTSVLSEPAVVDNVGMMMVYKASDLFPSGGAIQRLEGTGGSLVVEGDEMRDSLGWQIFVGDVTNDGVDDILVGAPAADGPDNQRASDGEAYIIEGSSTSIGDLMISGPGYSAPYILPGGHEVRLAVDISLSGKDREAVESCLSLSSEGLRSKVMVGPDGLIDVDPPVGLTPIGSGCGIDQRNGFGQAYWAFSLDWNFMMEGPLDVTVVLLDGSNRSFYREYPSALTLTKDVVLRGEVQVKDASGPLSGIGEWVLPGTELMFFGPKAVYSKAETTEIPDGALDIVLGEATGTIFEKSYSKEWSFVGTTPYKTAWDLSLVLKFPGGGPTPMGMEIEGGKAFRVNIDTTPPLPPEGVRAVSATNGLPVFDRSGRFLVSWNGSIGPELDPGGSGVKEFQVLEGSAWRPVIGDGGLTGTYYNGKGFQEMAFQRTDTAINFTTREWGLFGPDPYMIRYDDFSVRWYGHLVPEMNGSYLISFKGSGSVMVKMDGIPLMLWTSIIEDVEITLPFLTLGSVHPLEIYFSNELDSSFISLDIWDPTFTKLGRDEMPFSHTVNSTALRLDHGSSDVPCVRSLDWTGWTSADAEANVYIDITPPLIAPGWDIDWFNITTPTLQATVSITEGCNGSGMDLTSIAYSFEKEGLPKAQWGTEDLKLKVIEEGPMGATKTNLTIRPYLEEGWRGTVRFTAADLARNRGFSDTIWLGIDTDPPEISLLSPVNGKALFGTTQNLTVSLFDGTGSGPDGASIEVRYNSDGVDWTDWRSISPTASDRNDVFRGTVELAIGRHELQIRGRDIAGNPSTSASYVLDISETPVNRPPIPNIAHPPNGTKFFSGQIIELSATGTWDDGMGPYDTPLLSWFSSRDGYLGQGALVKVKLSVGIHTITLFANDGALGHNISRTVSIEVLDWNAPVPDDDTPPNEESIDPLSIFALAALLIVVLVLLVFVIIERIRAPRDHVADQVTVSGPPPIGSEE